VVRTYVNGDTNEYYHRDPIELILGPNVKDHHALHDMKLIHARHNEVTIKDGWLLTMFEKDSIYMQYYGTPIDEDFLPMIPDQVDIEKAIEYYIYKKLFEGFYLNSSVPDIPQRLQYVTKEFDFYFAQARYWCKLPTFQRMVQSLRIQRGLNKFYDLRHDRTVVRGGYFGGGYGRRY
jgi:hypothetical protein